MAVDLSHETQGDVQLVVILPARALDPVHQGEECGTDAGGWAQGDEQAVHHLSLAAFRA